MRWIACSILSLVWSSLTSQEAVNGNNELSKEQLESYLQEAERYLLLDPDSVRYFAYKSIKLAERLEDQKNQALGWWLAGSGMRLASQYDSAKLFFERALSLNGDSLLMANVHMGLGGIAVSHGNHDEALASFLVSASLFEHLGEEKRLTAAYSNIGIVMSANDDDERAISYFQKAIVLSREQQQFSSLLPALVSLANLFSKQEAYDSAAKYANECLSISREINSILGIAKSLSTLSKCNTHLGNPSLGLKQAVEGRILYEQMGNDRSARFIQLNEVLALKELERYEKALEVAQSIESKIADEPVGQNEHFYELVSTIYEEIGDSKRALDYHKRYFEEYAAYLTEEKERYLSDAEVRFDTQQKEKELLQLAKEQEIQELKSSRFQLIAFLVLAVVVLGTTVVLLGFQKKLLKQREQMAINEQQLLRSQMNPHFLFNALASIQDYIMVKQPREAVRFLARFGELVRDILEGSRQQYIPLGKEIQMLKNFVAIEQLRFEKNIDFHTELRGIEDAESIMVPPMFIQPFVENSLQHGFDQKNGGRVEVIVEKRVDDLHVTIQDDGVGFSTTQQIGSRKSLATQITKERLASVSKKPIGKILFEIGDRLSKESQVVGTRVMFQLPYKIDLA